MNQAEIMTLLNAKVKEEAIVLAITAGKIEAAMRSASRDVHRAREFHDNATWTEILRLMQGELNEKTGHEVRKEKWK